MRQSYDHYHGRRVDFCERDDGSVCVGSSGKTAKVSAMPSPEKPPLLTPKKDKVPVLLSFLPNETALVTDSEDDSDANEALHGAETMPGEAHASMPPSPLSPCRTCASGPNPSPTCIGCEGDYPDCRDDRAALPLPLHPHPTFHPHPLLLIPHPVPISTHSLPLIPRCTMRVFFFVIC